jgi:hypothetical protein
MKTARRLPPRFHYVCVRLLKFRCVGADQRLFVERSGSPANRYTRNGTIRYTEVYPSSSHKRADLILIAS